jgi:dihydroorotate dehydrogenase electron transfer subunit
MQKIQQTLTVIGNNRVCPKFYRLRLDAPLIVDRVQPGQFIHIRVSAGLEPLFRRPFSVHRAKKQLEILYENVGKGTALLAEKKRGDQLDILGPLGNSFSLPPQGVKKVIMVGGGVGVAPFLALAEKLKGKGRELILLYGARTKEYVFPMKDFRAAGCQVFIATDDGSKGIKGLVTKLFTKIDMDPMTTMLYTCGPRPMMAAVQEFARAKRLFGEASCEEVMACGLGACLGCSIRTTKGFKTVCYDGPVFNLRELIFER